MRDGPLPKQVLDQLEGIANAQDFATASDELVNQWTSMNIGLEAVAPILEFMENHSAIDFGLPGALAHFVERFYKKGYEEKLLESISRKPTQQTVWMLNRIINGTKDPAQKQRFVTTMTQARQNPLTDQITIDSINHFLARLGVT
jgi:hypothetical protein